MNEPMSDTRRNERFETRRLFVALVAAVTLGAMDSAFAVVPARAVYVNAARVSPATLHALEVQYRAVVPNGRYWYDAHSGLWGRQGGAALGRIDAGLKLGGRLRADASNGNTRVFVNGRRLPAVELQALVRLVGRVAPGRYWLDAYGNAGFEGGPAIVNIVAAHRQARRRNAGGWNRSTPGGNWGGDGGCTYYSHPDGPSVMIGNC